MARLILLNGPPGVGKSTIAQRYVDEHPLALNLDIDTVRSLLGGWLDDPRSAGLAARRLALEMAEAHLLDGHDVVVPQLVAVAGFIEELEAVAIDAGVPFREVVLWVEVEVAAARFDGRLGEASVPGRFNPSELSDDGGGAIVVPPHHERLSALLPHRPNVVVLDASGTLDETYAALLTALGLTGGGEVDRCGDGSGRTVSVWPEAQSRSPTKTSPSSPDGLIRRLTHTSAATSAGTSSCSTTPTTTH